MEITPCISELLVFHDCVIIPGFGGFIGNYAPARIDPVHHSFLPPGKKLLFNVNLKQNDGLLANHVASVFGISYDDAVARIEEMAERCRYTLKSGKSFIFEGVGRLYLGREGNLQFEQDKSVNLLPDAFGLAPFISPPVGGATTPVRSERSLTVVGAKGAVPHRRTLKAVKWAAALAIPVGLAAVIGVTQYERTGSSTVENAGIFSSMFSRFSSASLVDKKEAPTVAPETFFQQDPAPSVFDDQTEMVEEPLEEVDSQETPVSPSNTGDPFAIIIGAFKSEKNALRYIEELKGKGIQASIFDKSSGGLHRVTVGSFSLREEAEQLLSSSKSGDFPDAWLLVK